MKLKEITAKQFALETGKFLGQAQREPLLVRSEKGPALVIRRIQEDDLADELVTANLRFRASIRRARRNRAAGRGIPLEKVRKLIQKG